jgi:SpoVK/Ycf46/Vps4 family AAA+-type ATPase
MNRHVADNGRFEKLVEAHPGIHDSRTLPDDDFSNLWDSIILPDEQKDRLLANAVLNFTARAALQKELLPVHGVILLVGPPGTGKTSIARALASRTAKVLETDMQYFEIDPHALASAALGQSQKLVTKLLSGFISEQAGAGPCIVLLDEVEALATDRRKLSLEANPVDVHRATDAVLTQLDQLAGRHPGLLFLATSNFAGAIDGAFVSRADLVEAVELPDETACGRILIDTLSRIRAAIPAVRDLTRDPDVKKAIKASVGLDGRQIRKAVTSALAHDKSVATNPKLLTAAHVLAAIERASVQSGECKEAS